MNADPSVLILGEDVALPNGVGIAEVVWPGEDVTVVTWDTARAWAHQAAESVVADGIGCEVIDLSLICPWDQALVIESVARNGRLVVAHHAVSVAGFGADPAALVPSAAVLPGVASIKQAIATVIQSSQ